MDAYTFIQRNSTGRALHIQWDYGDWENRLGYSRRRSPIRPIRGADAPEDYECPHADDGRGGWLD